MRKAASLANDDSSPLLLGGHLSRRGRVIQCRDHPSAPCIHAPYMQRPERNAARPFLIAPSPSSPRGIAFWLGSDLFLPPGGLRSILIYFLPGGSCSMPSRPARPCGCRLRDGMGGAENLRQEATRALTGGQVTGRYHSAWRLLPGGSPRRLRSSRNRYWECFCRRTRPPRFAGTKCGFCRFARVCTERQQIEHVHAEKCRL